MTYVFRHSIHCAVVLLATSFGCADVAEPGLQSVTSELAWVPQQGRLLLGFNAPDARLMTFDAATYPGIVVDTHGQLVAGARSGTGFQGVQFSSVATDGTTPLTLQIDQVIPPVGPDDKWQYVLSQSSDGVNWTTACDARNPLIPLTVPIPVPTPAIAMNGFWVSSLYFAYSRSVTFSCATGVAAKCDSWGFAVDNHWPTVTPLGKPSSGSGADMMQACTRMARADYCASGMPNTLDGTPIQIDTVFSGVFPPHHDGMQFEAAWRGVAALRDHAIPGKYPALCLTKLRWSTLPIGGNCPLLLPDPRNDSKGRYCEDYGQDYLEAHGALLYSSSSYMDAGVYTYTDSAGFRLTTSNLPPESATVKPTWSPHAVVPAGLDFPILGQHVQFEASIFAPDLPVTIPEANVIPVYSYYCSDGTTTSDVMTTASTPADPHCQQIAKEGWVFPPNKTGWAPLRRWVDPDHKRSNTTTVSPTEMAAAGWQLAEVVGGVLRAGINVNVRWNALPATYSYTIDVVTPTGTIASCVNNAAIPASSTGVTSFAYTGACPGLNNLAVNHTDLIGFRVTATSSTPGQPIYVGKASYDGFSSDVYVDLPTTVPSMPSVLTVTWNALADSVYSIDVVAGSTRLRCADTNLLANDTSYVHIGRCWSASHTIPTREITEVRLCAYAPGSTVPRTCTAAKHDNTLPTLAITLKG
jgi:hypothetical protein